MIYEYSWQTISNMPRIRMAICRGAVGIDGVSARLHTIKSKAACFLPSIAPYVTWVSTYTYIFFAYLLLCINLKNKALLRPNVLWA